MPKIYYALGLHMHQPPLNLDVLIETNQLEAKQIILSYERAVRYAYMYEDVAFLHIGFSGVLLNQLQNPKIIDKYKKFVDIPKMIEMYRCSKNIEILGMGFYHPIFPLIPNYDWSEQLKLGVEIVEKTFGRRPKGFLPSEMAFSMEMIPALKSAGYEYVVIDDVHINPVYFDEKPDCFKPYLARYKGVGISVIPRNCDISQKQAQGMDEKWFLNEVEKKIREYPGSESQRLITTWSDGENGYYFRQPNEKEGFYGRFFVPLLDKIKDKKKSIKMISLSDFINKHPANEETIIQTGTGNISQDKGYDFSRWNGSQQQRDSIKKLYKISRKYRGVELNIDQFDKESKEQIRRARKYILNAETSCYLFWGDAWLTKMNNILDKADMLLQNLG